MIVSTTRTGDCGCGGRTRTANGSKQPCGCEERRPPEVHGGCECVGPERCGIPCLERPLYSAGQLLTADNLRLGQRYVEERFALRRYVDGMGIVCGLFVRCDPDERGWVIVDPGYAIDCCGHDLVLCEQVRFNLCGAIAECPKPVEPCEPVPEKEPEGPVRLASVGPARQGTHIYPAGLVGVVTDSSTGQPISGAQVMIDTTPRPTATADASGQYQINGVPEGRFTATAAAPGYRSAILTATFRANFETVANFPLPPLAQTEVPTAFHTYVLRVEGLWEGREPVPVITGRATCDPRPECRPSKEVASVRLCVEPLEERSARARAKDRTDAFRHIGQTLFARIAYALESWAALPSTQQTAPNRGRAIADALLAALHDEPPRSSCNLTDLICDVRRLLKGEQPQCFSFPNEVLGDPERALVGYVGQLLDDLREEYLALGCDDCCEHTGIRLAHVIIQETLADCAGNGCSLAGIDSHSPSRETLHPRTAWWQPDMVAVYDAYFRDRNEAGVLLTGRGLQVEVRAANTATFSPVIPPASVRDWMTAHDGQGELSRIGVYEQSILYAPFATGVVLWTVADRVVAITLAHYGKYEIQPMLGGHVSYLRYALTFPAVRSAVAPSEVSPAEKTPIEKVPTDKIPTSKTPIEGAPIAKTPMGKIPAEKPPVAEKDIQEGTIDLAELKPAPFQKLIRGIGAKMEEMLYRAGKTTLTSLLETPDSELGEIVRDYNVSMVKEQAHEILTGRTPVDSKELGLWTDAARKRLSDLERRRK